MHPVLFKIGWFEAHTYGLFLMISFIIGIYLSVVRARKSGIDPNVIIDLSIIIIISALVGSRILYVIFHLEEFENNILDIINPLQSDGTVGIYGLTVLGGIVLSIINCFLYLRYKKLPVLQIFNILTPGLALGTGITRIGCFFHGCCFGTECSTALGVVFPPNSPAGALYPGLAIHPAQLYASFGGFVVFILLITLEKKQFFRNKVFFLYLIFYGISRFVVDTFRYYEESMVLLRIGSVDISVNQGISILMLVFGILSIVYLRYRENLST